MKDGLSGSGYNMPQSAYLKKMERTCMYEDKDQLYNFYRDSLKDLRPDKPLFESDQTRRNNFSEDRLNIRHVGKRVATMPDLPDGTFLDFDGLQSDVRGTALDPDMKQHRRQQEARGKFIKQGNDEDNSVPSAGWNPTHLIRDMTAQFYPLKQRMKIFDDSMNGMSAGTGINQKQRKNTAECMQETDASQPEMQDEICYNRANKTNTLSNNTSIGWRRTTDHMFQVAKYGMMRGKTNANADIIKNRSNAHVTHDVQVSYRDQMVSKALSLKMIDLSKRKKNDMDAAADNDNILGESTKTQVRTKKITPADMAGMQARETDESQGASAHTQLGGEQAQHVTGAMTSQQTDSNRMGKVVVDPFIIEYMASINRKMSPRDVEDLRENVLQSVELSGLMVEQKTKQAQSSEVGNELMWMSGANFERGNSMKMANYRKMKAMPTAKDQNHYDFEEYKQSQKTSGQRRGNIQNPELYGMEVIDFDHNRGVEVVGTKLVGKRGSKYMNPYMDRGDTDNALLSELTARN
jgi:hypothetical protein